MKRNFLRTGFILFSTLFFTCRQPASKSNLTAAFKPDQVEQNPSSKVLSPEESMKTMHLPEGYHLQLVASEPMIQEPVAIVWDGNGRMYVAEMRSYMQDINGTGERFPTCRISRLEDTDGDGKMDKSTIFIDKLVLPRMMLTLDDRLIVNETYTYNLHSYRDTNGDGIADEKKLVFKNDAEDKANLEHQRSGLIWNTDNWIYTTTSPARYRYTNGMLEVDSLADAGGQWGLTHDDYGRLFFSSAGGETPALDFQQNPIYGRLDLKDQRIDDFDIVYPIIATPDVEGGKKRLKTDSTLNHFTASCGQTVYRGDKLPADLKGDLLICEPVGRLIRRAKVLNQEGKTVLKNAYDKSEFIASTDMNFRPVNMDTGPDGNLYIVDMYHGIIQEGNWTKPGSYLRPQILRKNLDKNINRGRIYRLVHDDFKPGEKPDLLDASSEKLISYLSHPNGWWRDNAQKLLVVRNDKTIVPELEDLALGKRSFWQKLAFWKSKPAPIAKVHALWTLEGLKSINENILISALKDTDPQVRKTAVKISEMYLKKKEAPILSSLEPLKNDLNADVKIQLAASLRYSKNDKARAILKELIDRNNSNELLFVTASRSLNEADPEMQDLLLKTAKMRGDDKELVFAGAAIFRQFCSICHGLDGKGLPSEVAPPLAGSPRVNGNKNVLISIILNGLTGPVNNKNYSGTMVALGNNDDEYIASVASFIRTGLGNQGGLIQDRDVEKVRKRVGGRETPWTLDELKQLHQ
ncbi:c-type cytochrome [Dyadobacter subterraneus]|uniref:C-type cytochrome n=1 Tax=Dyadobacter subterraneus TaxID=2773304 RepID=A0ABR9WA97_9BACT|nr:c-type cytochrome [Dyadobacter subterraneus]MBE9462404.1 c-type cytochrome [Dyadobacter subterraneus]